MEEKIYTKEDLIKIMSTIHRRGEEHPIFLNGKYNTTNATYHQGLEDALAIVNIALVFGTNIFKD